MIINDNWDAFASSIAHTRCCIYNDTCCIANTDAISDKADANTDASVDASVDASANAVAIAVDAAMMLQAEEIGLLAMLLQP